MKKLFIILILFNITNASYGEERFIPLELFTGGEIRTDNEIKFTEANLVFGDKKRKKIIGPENWKHPYKAETGNGPQDQIPSAGCGSKWKYD